MARTHQQRLSASSALRILVASSDDEQWARLQSALAELGEVRRFSAARGLLPELVRDLDRGDDSAPRVPTAPPTALIIGERCTDLTREQLLAQLAERSEHLHARRIAVFVAGGDGDIPPELADALAIRYALDPRLPDDQLRALVACVGDPSTWTDSAPEDPGEVARLRRILDVAQALARSDELPRLSAILEEAVRELTGAERGYCLFHDAGRGILWSESDADDRDDEFPAFRGLAGFSARVGAPVAVARAGDDPRYRGDIDDPAGTGQESIAAQPVVDSDGVVHIVLLAVRSQTPFEQAQLDSLVELAEQIAPVVQRMALRSEIDAVIREQIQADRRGDIFRAEAMDAYTSRGRSGDVVRVSPPWIRWAYWLLLVLLGVGAVYLVVGRVDEYSVGPSVVRMTGRSDITAHVAGKVVALEVAPGQRVAPGQVVARLYDATEEAELARYERDFQTQLRARMLDPGDPGARQAVASARADMRRARARLEERTLRAPSAGTVADIRVQPSQHVAPGDLVASLVADDTRLSVTALLPGADRPKLRPGMSLRLELEGYRYAYQDLIIDKVSDDIIGPAEARRYLGKRLGDGIPVTGPVVLVEARLPAREFHAHGKNYRYQDGLRGRAEVRTRTRRIIVALIPPLEEL